MKIRLKKDDRYDITRRNEVGRRNTTEVSGDNRYTEETRRILEKLGRLATAVANHFGWDPEIVMRDFVKDLAIINNPALITELDTNNPIDRMTDQLMRMYLADEEAFNIFRNTALAQIMNMSEERAIRTLEQILGRGQISTSRTNQFIGNRNARRIGHHDSTAEEIVSQYRKLKKKYNMETNKKETSEGWFEIIEKDKNNETYLNIMTGVDEEAQIIDETHDYIVAFWRNYEARPFVDSKEDKQRFIAKFGEDAFNRYNRISQKLQGQYKDMTWLTANVEANELNEIFNNAEFKGYEPTDENEDFVMFKIENLDMCQKLSEGANWCIAKPEAYNTYANYGAEYKFYINKKTGEKYCVASVRGMNEIVDQNNNELAKLPDGVPGEVYTSAVVHENKTSSEATLETALRHIELLSIAQLRTAYNDLFGDELSLLEDDEVKSWLTAKLPEVDTNDLKRYIEQHLDAFAVLPQVGEEDFDEDDFDEEDFDEDDFDEDDFDEDNYDDEDLVEDSYITDVITETEVETLTADLKAYLASYNEVKVDSWFNDDNVIMILTITGDDKDEILNYIDDFDEDWDWDDNDQIVAKGQPQPVLNKESVLQHIINKYKLNDFRNKQFKISNEASKQGQIEDTDFSNMKFKITDMGKEFYNETEFEAKGTFEIMVDIPFEKKN